MTGETPLQHHEIARCGDLALKNVAAARAKKADNEALADLIAIDPHDVSAVQI